MIYFRFSQHTSTATRLLVGQSILGLLLFALAGCGSDSGGSSSGSGIDMGASAATGGLLNMCSDSAPGCLTETTQQDGVIIRSCQEFFMPAQAVLTQASCDELATNPNETATFYQGGAQGALIILVTAFVLKCLVLVASLVISISTRFKIRIQRSQP